MSETEVLIEEAEELGEFGRMPAPPPGYYWMQDPAVAAGLAIRASIALYDVLGLEIPDHLAELNAAVPDQLPDDPYLLVEDDFGIPPPPINAPAVPEQ